MTINEKNGKSSSVFATFFIGFALLANLSVNAAEVALVPRPHADSFVRVKTIVDVAGSLHVETQDKKTLNTPTKVNAELFYDEAGLSGEFNPAVRHYWDAQANFEFRGEKKEERKLREDRRLIVLNNNDISNNRFWSPYGMLQQRELDLLNVVGSAFPPEDLLPNASIEETETWKLDDETAARFFRLENVTHCDFTNSIEEVTEAKVKINISGSVSGIADGAKTEMQVEGNYHFDRKSKIVTWLAVGIQETARSRLCGPRIRSFSQNPQRPPGDCQVRRFAERHQRTSQA